MTKILDLTGQVFGRLNVIKINGRAKNRSVNWLCKCTCGNIVTVTSANLVNGHTKSCGCLKLEHAKSMGSARKTKLCKRGHDKDIVGRDKNGSCKECRRITGRIRDKTERRRETNRALEKTPKRKKYRREWQRAKRQTEEYKEYFIPYKKQYDKEHPEQIRLSRLKQKTNRKLRIVSWGQEGMREFYLNMPDNMTEDHYIPLQGDEVSGLHVIWNLSYLSQSDNSKKNNNIDLIEASEWYGKILEEAGLK